MAKKGNLAGGDLIEDEEMVIYKKSSLNAVTFHIVRDEEDLESPKKADSFKPDMAHQIFGETEMIFGYKQLNINLFYLHNSVRCCVEVKYNEKIPDNDICQADDIMKSLNPWLPSDFKTDKMDFLKEVQNEDHCIIYGDLVDSFEGTQGGKFKITLADTKNSKFKDFHQRFETFIVWFIDGANYIDLEDEKWMIFYLYEEYEHPKTHKIHRSPVGFCTVYKFFLYPESVRPRISQFFILPTHQKKGLGTKLYTVVYNYLKEMSNSGDITVEEPTEIFQKIRDYCDSLEIYKALNEKHVNITTQNQKQWAIFLKEYKICKRQAQRVVDILTCLITHKNGYQEYVKFTNSIKNRIANDIERETRGSKRVCNQERTGILTDHVDKKALIDAEYARYIDSLEWPTNKLRIQLAKN